MISLLSHSFHALSIPPSYIHYTPALIFLSLILPYNLPVSSTNTSIPSGVLTQVFSTEQFHGISLLLSLPCCQCPVIFSTSCFISGNFKQMGLAFLLYACFKISRLYYCCWCHYYYLFISNSVLSGNIREAQCLLISIHTDKHYIYTPSYCTPQKRYTHIHCCQFAQFAQYIPMPCASLQVTLICGQCSQC